MADYIIKNATIVTVNPNREVLWDAALVIENGKIKDIGPIKEIESKFGNSGKVIDANGKILFPGFVNTHNHLFQSLLKGLGDDMVLSKWVTSMTFPASCYLNEEDCYTAAMLGCVEGLHSGITTMLDFNYPHPVPYLSDAVIKAFADLKIRGIYGRGSVDAGLEFGTPAEVMQDTKTIEEDCRRVFKKYDNTENGRIKVWFAPSIAWTSTKETLTMLWNLANEFNTGYTIHISETPFDREATKQMHGFTDAELLEHLGITGPNVLMVHCVHLTERDIRMAKYYDMKISHNPVSNMYLSSGVAPVPRMLESGITVSLGVDGAASNNSQDMLELMKFTALMHKVSTMDPTIITAEKVLEMATIDGARAVGLENEIGSLEVGKKADIIIFDPGACAKSVPMHNPVSTLVYSSSEQCIDTVFVDGQMVMESGKILTCNEKEFLKKAQLTADNLVKKADIKNCRQGHVWKSLAF